jgi:hypothetical protein
MSLPNAPAWDTTESCMWFEIAYKDYTILCRTDAPCFQKSLMATRSVRRCLAGGVEGAVAAHPRHRLESG